ncbi:hypothetical protein LXA43DRAFT_100192 [Ganoderma leucocontextum]|nr:hypothetical protein LXA43DRAFT_100192 [Ganoderma leucocontextum]
MLCNQSTFPSSMTPMASVRLLQCPETLAEIFSHLEPGPGSRIKHTHAIELEHRELRRTLAAAARSSRALTEHALKVLWRRLGSV